jgi:hypothetical protein
MSAKIPMFNTDLIPSKIDLNWFSHNLRSKMEDMFLAKATDEDIINFLSEQVTYWRAKRSFGYIDIPNKSPTFMRVLFDLDDLPEQSED